MNEPIEPPAYVFEMKHEMKRSNSPAKNSADLVRASFKNSKIESKELAPMLQQETDSSIKPYNRSKSPRKSSLTRVWGTSTQNQDQQQKSGLSSSSSGVDKDKSPSRDKQANTFKFSGFGSGVYSPRSGSKQEVLDKYEQRQNRFGGTIQEEHQEASIVEDDPIKRGLGS